MISFYFKRYKIVVEDVSDYDLNSSDNEYQYQKVYHSHTSEYKPASMHGIKVFSDDKIINSTLLLGYGGATGIHERSAVIDEDRLLVCCCDSVFCLTIPDLESQWVTKADDATCFGIYKLVDGYVIHGELEITKLMKSGGIEWSFGGEDIFVTQDGMDDFSIKKDCVEVKDWNNRIYRISFDGKTI